MSKIRSWFVVRGAWCASALATVALLLTGCTAPKATSSRPFIFGQDTFAFANELVWEYRFDEATGRMHTSRREPKPDYTHHCFVVARSVRQFFQHARFEPSLPVAEDSTYRRLIRRVVKTSPRRELGDAKRIVIPGYSNLFTFSLARAALLKAECGGAWQSYFQRGHWRVIWPFTGAHQAGVAREFSQALAANRAPIVHLIRFPSLKINHAVVLLAARETEAGVEFSAYDPNAPEKPVPLTFDRATRQFTFPRNGYFEGGRVAVYEIYRGLLY